MSSSSMLLKVFLRLLLLVGVFQFLIAAEEGGRKLKDDVIVGIRENEIMRDVSKFDLNYSNSKRKVPNGPDPIHNRRAGSSRQPPGQARNGRSSTNQSKISGDKP
ncbi:hypothetical protein Salat_1961800 [Sesamum alatum]|uniref:CLAVATA3/ESR (CLE)-related protein 25-like n=1 Tax=Sesamum alatum TaxID=300844 RepID=A0AAE1Y4X9_9LAMI|nr:hypothetical protein Salat_1961800 [Sesamum alatum]